MNSHPPEESLKWLHVHRDQIQSLARVFLKAVVHPDDPIKRAHLDDVPPQEPPLIWDSEDHKKQIILGCALAHQSVARNLPIGYLVRLILLTTDFQAGAEPLQVLWGLQEEGILEIISKSDGTSDLPDSLMDYYTYLSTEALQILTGLCLTDEEVDEEEEDEAPLKFSDLPSKTRKAPTALLLLKLGMALQDRSPAYSRLWGNPGRHKSSKDSSSFIDSASKTLRKRLSHVDYISKRMAASQLSCQCVAVIAYLAAQKLSGASTTTVGEISSAIGNSPEERLGVIRHLRRGPLVPAGLVEMLRGSHCEIDDEFLDVLLHDIDEEDAGNGNSPLTIFENRIKPIRKTKPKGEKGGDDLEDDYVFRN